MVLDETILGCGAESTYACSARSCCTLQCGFAFFRVSVLTAGTSHCCLSVEVTQSNVEWEACAPFILQCVFLMTRLVNRSRAIL